MTVISAPPMSHIFSSLALPVVEFTFTLLPFKLLSMLRLQKRWSSNIPNYLTSAYSFKALSTSASKVEAAFSDANAATFLAAATTPASIPKLQGLSEVIVAGAYKPQ